MWRSCLFWDLADDAEAIAILRFIALSYPHRVDWGSWGLREFEPHILHGKM